MLKTPDRRITFISKTGMVEDTEEIFGDSSDEDIPEFIEAVKLGSGKSFGELALINNKPRAATIKCITPCHFAVMSKADYKKCL